MTPQQNNPEIWVLRAAPKSVMNHPDVYPLENRLFITVCKRCQTSRMKCHCENPVEGDLLIWSPDKGLNQTLLDRLHSAQVEIKPPAPASTPETSPQPVPPAPIVVPNSEPGRDITRPAYQQNALALAGLGILIALIPGGQKKAHGPECVGWENICTNDAQTLIQRFQAHPELTNYAMVAKAQLGGLLFLDDDGGIVAAFQAAGFKMQATRQHRSCSGGSHYIYSHTPKSLAFQTENGKAYISEKNSGGKGELWSLRMNNAYIVGPGSIAMNHDGVLAEYITTSDLPIIPIPDDLLEFLKVRYETQKTEMPETEFVEAMIPEGARNSTLASIAGRARQVMHMDKDQLEVYLLSENAKRCDPPLPEAEVKQIANSISGYAVKDERVLFNGKESGTSAPADGRHLSLVTLSSLTPKHVRWLWLNRILADKPNVIFGEPGLGKGFACYDFIGRMTTGQDFYDFPNPNPACDAIICCDEDDWRETILPRLLVARADPNRVHLLKMTRKTANSVEEGLMALGEDLPELARLLAEYPNVRIIMIDPLATYMGELDPNKDKEVRPIYTQMSAFSEKHNVSFILVAHPNKNEDASAINRMSGAKALTSVFRNTWLVEKDPDDKSARLMLSVKGNLAAENAKTSLKFRIENVAETDIKADDGKVIQNIGKLVWLGTTEKDADEVLQAAASGGRQYKQKREEMQVMETLKEFIANGAQKAKDFYQKMSETDVNEYVVKKAKAKVKPAWRRIFGEVYWAASEAALDAKLAELIKARTILFEKSPTQAVAGPVAGTAEDADVIQL